MVKNFVCQAGDTGLTPGSGRSPGEGNGNPLQYSCLENSMDRGARWAAVHGVSKSQQEWVHSTLGFSCIKVTGGNIEHSRWIRVSGG